MNLLAAETIDSNLILQYIVYGAIIVAGIVALVLIGRANRLPKHGELKNRLKAFSVQLDGAPAQEHPSYKQLKAISKLIYRLDKLVLITFSLAQKERDGDLDNLSVKLERARGELAAYRAGRCADGNRLEAARAGVGEAIVLLDKIIARDEKIGKKKEKEKDA